MPKFVPDIKSFPAGPDYSMKIIALIIAVTAGVLAIVSFAGFEIADTTIQCDGVSGVGISISLRGFPLSTTAKARGARMARR